MSEKILKKYSTKLDSKNRMTIRDAGYEYYEVNMFEDGYIVLKPKVLMDADEISVNTLSVMDNAVANYKKGKNSKPVNFEKYIKMLNLEK